MPMYKQINDDTLILSQQAIYGSSRLGVLERDEIVSIDSSLHPQMPTIPDPLTENVTHWSRGHKRYELTNHLGNVLATVSDRKLPVYANNSFNYYKAEVMTANDYYAFGMAEPKRSFDTSDYRFGFGGHEKIDEIHKANEWYTFGDYGYDPRVVQRPRTEPLTAKYPQLSPYVAFRGNPIMFSDPSGEDAIATIEGNTITVKAVIYVVNNQINKINVAEAQKAINRVWGGDFKTSDGKYNVKFDITIQEASPYEMEYEGQGRNPGENIVYAQNELYRSNVRDNNIGLWAKNKNDQTYAHESGHFLGLADQYEDVIYDAGNLDIQGKNGTMESWAYESAGKNELMATSKGGGVSQKDVDAIANFAVSNQKNGVANITSSTLSESGNAQGLAAPSQGDKDAMQFKAQKNNYKVVDKK